MIFSITKTCKLIIIKARLKNWNYKLIVVHVKSNKSKLLSNVDISSVMTALKDSRKVGKEIVLNAEQNSQLKIKWKYLSTIKMKMLKKLIYELSGILTYGNLMRSSKWQLSFGVLWNIYEIKCWALNVTTAHDLLYIIDNYLLSLIYSTQIYSFILYIDISQSVVTMSHSYLSFPGLS